MALRRFALTDLLTCVRASAGLVRNAAGVYSSVGNNVLRVSHEGGSFCLLAEETRTNSLPRNDMSGAVVGVLGSGGALPTGWSVLGMPAGAVEVVATGTENGLAYVDVRLNGTPTGNIFVRPVGGQVVTASASQVWGASAFVRSVAGDLTNITDTTMAIQQQNGPTPVGSTVSAPFDGTITQNLRRTVTRTFSADTTDNVLMQLRMAWTSGAVDITLRFAAPQLELGSFATSPIITSGSAVTRQADQIKLNDGLLSQVYGGGPVSVLAEFEAQYVSGGSVFPRIWQMDDGTVDNRIVLQLVESTGVSRVQVASAGIARYSTDGAYTTGSALKVASRFQSGLYATSRNGGAVVTSTASEIPTGLATLGIGNVGFNTNLSHAPLLRLRKFILYPAALTNAELEALSA